MLSNSLPEVAIIGLANVGKSTLFNRLVGSFDAIVSKQPGTTVDRNEGLVRWGKNEFIVADTAGLDKIDLPIDEQINQAIAEADVVLLLTAPGESQSQTRQRIGKKPFVAAVNKIDDFSRADGKKFLVDGVIPISALHGKNINTLLDAIVAKLPAQNALVAQTSQIAQSAQTKIAIVGRPNVGKSTLLNRLVGYNRALVSPIAGTTRDTVEALWRNVVLLDTAGLRRPNKIKPGIQRQAAAKALLAIKNAKIVIVVADSTEGLTHQDLKIIRACRNQKKPVILAINKIDLRVPDQTNLARFKFLKDLPSVAISAQNGANIMLLVQMVEKLTQNF